MNSNYEITQELALEVVDGHVRRLSNRLKGMSPFDDDYEAVELELRSFELHRAWLLEKERNNAGD